MSEAIVKQLYVTFKEEIIGKIKQKEFNPMLWISTITKMMIMVESLVNSGPEKSKIIVQVLVEIIDKESGLETVEKENLLGLIQTIIPGLIDNIILATKTINIKENINKFCKCF